MPGGWRERVRRVGRTGWLWPTLLTLVVAGAGVGHAQPWRDELATWSAASRPLPDLLRLAGTVDATTAPYYLLLHGWVAVAGDSVTALRLPSVLAVAAAAGLTAVLGERLFGRRAGLLGGLLFAVLPSTSRYGQEARPYALATLLAVAATLLLVAALRRPGPARWAGYSGAVTALGLAHLVALTVLAAHALAVAASPARGAPPPDARTPPPVGRTLPPDAGTPPPDGSTPPDGTPVPGRAEWRGWQQRRRRAWLLALLPAALVLTPLALLARGQRGRQLAWVDPARLGELPGLPGALTASAAVGGLLVGLAVVGAAGRGRWGLVLLAAVALPAGLLFVGGLVTPLWVPRYLVFTTPFLCLPAGALLASVRLPAALAVVGLAVGLGAPAQLDLRRTHDWPRSAPVDYRGAARIVDAHQRPGDAVVYHPRQGFLFLDLGLAYHLGADRPRDALAVRDQRRAGDLWAVECDRPARCLAGVDRVWLVTAGRPADPARRSADPTTGRPPDPLAGLPAAKRDALAGWSPTDRWTVPGITVTLLTRPS
ncbi:glycosyltransferase family 39 protein [Micromonospora cathayae]|uniref:Glycosyltransferase family 39 protein n=1 Tax=Micromonospora cathayae TaxID=3028804 RepID=A0ABY7ZZ23_9ACTN|nr:glycosyltransferase family 39 protein [Micromonospora sp. HUAS 3]WDZ88255.1 glycosyltransferase family 39 protein [Micromonospora sp. HUAS 3]